MSKTFASYLNAHYSKSGEQYTHTRIKNDELSIKGGIYTIKNLKEFYKKYIKHVFDDRRYEFLTEKQYLEKGPIMLDFDFRYDVAVEERKHDSDTITSIIELYVEEIKKILVIPNNSLFPIYVFEKTSVNMMEDKTKDGIHMIIGINMDRNLQILLRNNVLKSIKSVFESLPLINTMEEVLDETITKGTTNWQLYGSRKPGNEPYLLTYHYDVRIIDSDDFQLCENDVKDFDIKNNFAKLTAQYKDHISFEMNDEIKEIYEELKGKQKKPKQRLTIVSKKMDIFSVTNHEQLKQLIDQFLDKIEPSEYQLKEAYEYTMCLTSEYYDRYDNWMRTGWALHNTHESLFPVWIYFSSQSQKFSFEDIHKNFDLWSRMSDCNGEGLKLSSLIYYAKNCNYEKYQKVREETIEYHVEKTIENPTDWDFATVLYHMYKDKYICVSIKKDWWYRYNKHRWEENEGGTDLRISISKELHSIYFNKQIELTKLMGSGTIDSTSDKFTKLSKKAQKLADITTNLKRRQSKDNIMREAKEIFYDRDFLDKVDCNPKLLCFNNGVFDFSLKVFRKGKPDDYLCKSTKIDYVKLTKKDDNTVEEINSFMSQLFPDEELKNYMWEHLASTLIGDNNDQTFNIYNGSGSNGKSKLIELMSEVLGDYKETVPSTLITSKRNSIGTTSSEIVALKGARYAVMQEPTKGDTINEGIMKEITGGDPLQGRALYKDSITFIPQFKLVVCTNVLLDVKSNDDGTWRRMRKVDFLSKFLKEEDLHKSIEEDDSKKDYLFRIDKKLGEKFKTWAQPFIAMLVDKAIETGGLVNECKAVIASSLSYRNTQDFFSEFITDKIRKCNGKHIKEQSLYEVFKQWYQLHHGKNIPKGRDLFEYVTKRFGKKQRGVWKDVTINYDYQDCALDEDF